MWIGEYQLGDLLPVVLWVRSGKTPTLPDAPPRAIIYSSTAQVESFLLPIVDQREETAIFHRQAALDGKYSTGQHVIQLVYAISSVVKAEIHRFNVLPGGNANGTGIAMEYFAVQPIRYLLVQNDSGALIRRKNPVLT